MTIKLQNAVEAYFEADWKGNPNVVAAAFTDNSIVKDKGKTNCGRDVTASGWLMRPSSTATRSSRSWSLRKRQNPGNSSHRGRLP